MVEALTAVVHRPVHVAVAPMAEVHLPARVAAAVAVVAVDPGHHI